mgnify:CR=1 FL=1
MHACNTFTDSLRTVWDSTCTRRTHTDVDTDKQGKGAGATRVWGPVSACDCWWRGVHTCVSVRVKSSRFTYACERKGECVCICVCACACMHMHESVTRTGILACQGENNGVYVWAWMVKERASVRAERGKEQNSKIPAYSTQIHTRVRTGPPHSHTRDSDAPLFSRLSRPPEKTMHLETM